MLKKPISIKSNSKENKAMPLDRNHMKCERCPVQIDFCCSNGARGNRKLFNS